MSIYSAPVSQLTYEDLKTLLEERAIENVRLEFKSEVPPKDSMLKKLSSFANTFGGRLIIGVSEDGKTGRIAALDGVVPQPGFKQQVTQWCADGLNPPLAVDVSDAIPMPQNPNLCFYVVDVVESELAPHFVNGRGGVWVRIGEHSNKRGIGPAHEGEIRALLDRRQKLVEFRAEIVNRSRTRADRSVSAGFARIEISFGPTFPRRQLCEQQELRNIAYENIEKHGGGANFPGTASSTFKWISQHESLIIRKGSSDYERASYLELNVWGLMFYNPGIALRFGSGTMLIAVPSMIANLLLFLRYSIRVLRAMGYSGRVSLDVTLRKVRSVDVANWSTQLYEVPLEGSIVDDEFSLGLNVDLEELERQTDAEIKPLVRDILFGLNQTNIGEPGVEDAFKQAYDKLQWKRPQLTPIVGESLGEPGNN